MQRKSNTTGKKNFVITLLIFTGVFIVSAQNKVKVLDTQPFSIGKSITIHSNVLNEDRVLNIYLPNGYNTSEKEYPVIYLLDGSANEDFIHVSGLVQFGSFSWINMLPESIVVGIANVDRKRDFTYPSTNKLDQEEFPTSGGSKKFIEFIETELLGLINQNFKVSKEKTIIGQSLGGLLASEILLKKPILFDNYIIVSPSVWWDNTSILKWEVKKDLANKKIYVAVGVEGPAMQTGATNLYYKLLEAYKDDKAVIFNFLEEQNHGDALHLALYDAFSKFFKP
ncbi:alpha/beta hydrolase [Patiriisocius hiemis]|uniref:Alpha/beta hydrolase-fold protein n=1 Tax=Patiriisocius hiemis TaxID=3075604 RepID=A0ABU2YH25_9FLAO|nr:alpha/beta hydrolase-fold protein [Constantimarinum sp. W242]MDT0556555.1 alpha/beta hydrolase-fold protein [Constantimarinum sp. W242]